MSAFAKVFLAGIAFIFSVTALMVGMVAAIFAGKYLLALLALAVAAYCCYSFVMYGERYARGET